MSTQKMVLGVAAQSQKEVYTKVYYCDVISYLGELRIGLHAFSDLKAIKDWCLKTEMFGADGDFLRVVRIYKGRMTQMLYKWHISDEYIKNYTHTKDGGGFDVWYWFQMLPYVEVEREVNHNRFRYLHDTKWREFKDDYLNRDYRNVPFVN